MVKIFVLQQCHGLSDFELGKHCIDRISFRKFLGFSDRILDKTTVWSSRKITIGNCKEEEIWAQLQSQLNCLGSTVIHSDFGYTKADKHRENKVKKGKVEMENR
jgi:IS5 family transposase